jgi:mannose-1-phosphate guanylyltransferase
MNRVFESIADAYGTEREQELINQNYPNCENISIDYAIMEKAEEIYVYPCDFGWSDLGTWGSLAQLSHKDGNGNSLISPNVKTFETSNCIVNVDGAKQVVVQGLDGYIVAERDGRLLICKISEEQRIKEFSAD